MSSNTSSPRSRCRSRLAADIVAAGEPLRELIAGLDPRDVPLSWAPEVLAAFVSVQRTVESGRVLMTHRAAEAKEWERQRFATPADWLAAQQGTTPGRARADLETSERLGDLNATRGAVQAGLLSPEQAGAVTDAATINPNAENDLLRHAQRDSLRRTRLEAERRKAEARTEADKLELEARVRRERCVRFRFAHGAGHMDVRGPVAAIKDLEQVIQRHVDHAFRTNRAPASRERRGNDAFDALIGLGRQGGSDAGPTTNAPTGNAPSPKAPLRRLTLVRVDLGAWMRGWVGPGELCEIGGTTVSITELRQTLGESILQLVLTNGEAVIDVVNLHRKPTVAQMIAKLFADSDCTATGCDRAARLEFDHRHDWAKVQVTELANLDLLCDHHHRLKTTQGWTLEPGTGRRPMRAAPNEAGRQAQQPATTTRPQQVSLLDTG